MNIRVKAFLFFLLCVAQAQSGFGKITLPSLVGDNMVLQQKAEVSIWGKAKAQTTVAVTPSWNNKKYTAQSSADGSWRLKVSTPAAGGPFTITLSDGESLVLNNILVGEVWVCSGQSNMSMPMIGYKNQPIKDSNAELLLANNPNIHLFSVRRAATRTTQEDCVGKWEVSSPKSARAFSAIGFEFGTILERSLHVPIGIIHSSWGGTPIEAWISEEGLKAFPHAKVIPPSDTTQVLPRNPASLYNGMIHPLLSYGIRGFLWYQGEANRNSYARYDSLMNVMITDWRARWGQGNSPFYYVQLAPYKYPENLNNSPYLREAQLRVMQQVPEVGMAVALDVGEENYIHPPNKSEISKRLAYLALAKTYGWEGLAHSGPVYEGMQVDGSKIQLTFSFAPNGLSTFGKELTDFEVAGDDRIFYPAQAEINAQGVVVSSPQVQNPVAARYAFKDWVVGSLYNVEGLPASSFRTDNWEK
ncbi:sialate O-acetylesterase [Persicitalea jodogahamensis]|uniref:9-O-acetylesterase n=1 Tax=Persicitalea jodogahamensis TaxID=402147 RepID=A0A8J3D284_9BACT|nr:sialate O-acetylesterase [Persicitalea jodogahamensis]GHB57223.1 9-O-acetylesterase [Persicitalea jodogahamensis]